MLTYTGGVKTRDKQSTEETRYPNYSRVPIADLKKSRKGKHHDLVEKIMEDLRESEPGYAVRIPLASTNQVSILNLRSAVVRKAASEKIKILTASDDENFYVWKASRIKLVNPE